MLTLPELLVLGFAGYRATQLVVHDSILDPARERLEMWHAADHESYFRSFVHTLLSCVYCSGWWLSVAALAVYLLTTGRWDHAPILVHGIEAFAVAGVQALLSRRDDSWGASR